MQSVPINIFTSLFYWKKIVLVNDGLMEKRKKLREIKERLCLLFSSAVDRIKSTFSELQLPPTLEILESIVTLNSPRSKSNSKCRKDRRYGRRDRWRGHCRNRCSRQCEQQQKKIYKEEFENFKNIQHRKYLNRREKRNDICSDHRNVTCCFDDGELLKARQCHTSRNSPCCPCERRSKQTADRRRVSLCANRYDDNWICQSESKILADKCSRAYHSRLPIDAKRSACSPEREAWR